MAAPGPASTQTRKESTALLGTCTRVLSAHNWTGSKGSELCLGPPWGQLGPIWADLCLLGAITGPTRANLGANLCQTWADLEPAWANLGPTWGQPGPIWGQPGPTWGQPQPPIRLVAVSYSQEPTWPKWA